MKKKMVKIAKGVKVSKAKEKAMEKRPGGSNVGEYKSVKKSEFAGPAGGAPMGSYPINTLKRAKSALAYARNAPNPEGIRKAVYKKYPELAPNKKEEAGKSKVKTVKKPNGKKSNNSNGFKRKVIKHLKEDMKGYKHEFKEDAKLLKGLKKFK